MVSGLGEAGRVVDLPPGYTLVSLRERGDAFAHALAVAAEAGAGTLVCAWRYDLAEFAVVLEPDEPLASARRAFFAGMNATADAIAANCAPEREVSFVWPDTLIFDRGLLGGVRLGWPRDCAEHAVPAWLVLGVMLRVVDMAHVHPGLAPLGTTLVGAGVEMVESEAIVGSFARHLMTGFDEWNDCGFAPIAAAYLARLSGKSASERRRIDGNGDLVVHGPAAGGGATVRASLVAGLARAAWYDPDQCRPKLG